MQNLDCGQVIALLTFYIDSKLTPKLMKDIEYHLNTCSFCRNKYMQLKKIYDNYADIKAKIENRDDEFLYCESNYNNLQYQYFKENLSAYIDNELNIKDNLRIKKTAIINPNARIELENIIFFRKTLQDAYNKTKENLKQDFSGNVICKIYDCLPKYRKSNKLSLQNKIKIIINKIFKINKNFEYNK